MQVGLHIIHTVLYILNDFTALMTNNAEHGNIFTIKLHFIKYVTEYLKEQTHISLLIVLDKQSNPNAAVQCLAMQVVIQKCHSRR
jgi:hypothetical protein